MSGKQLVQGFYAIAWVGVQPTTYMLQGRYYPLSHGALIKEKRLILKGTNRKRKIWKIKSLGKWLFSQSVKTRDAQASLGYPDRCLCCDGRPTTLVLCNAEQ